jgi:hypothetical protein
MAFPALHLRLPVSCAYSSMAVAGLDLHAWLALLLPYGLSCVLPHGVQLLPASFDQNVD